MKQSLLTRHGPEKPATLAIQGSLPTEPWRVCFPRKDDGAGTESAGARAYGAFQGAAILPVSRRGPLVLIIYLVLMGCSELKRRTPNYLSFSLHVLPCHPRLPNKGSYRHSHFAACLTHGPGYDPHGAAASGH